MWRWRRVAGIRRCGVDPTAPGSSYRGRLYVLSEMGGPGGSECRILLKSPFWLLGGEGAGGCRRCYFSRRRLRELQEILRDWVHGCREREYSVITHRFLMFHSPRNEKNVEGMGMIGKIISLALDTLRLRCLLDRQREI